MALLSINGLPGAGKTEYNTYLALKHYKKTNSILRQLIRKIKQEELIINNVYSNYAILLDKKRNIYSRIIKIEDLDNTYSFLPNSYIAIDEPQLKHDSLDFKEFPRAIGMFLQLHRHFGIKNIVFSTQHPNRLVMYEKNVMTEYDRIFTSFQIPFTPIKLAIIRSCYEIVDYDYITSADRDVRRAHDIKRKFVIYNTSRVHKRYDDKYLSVLNINKPKLERGTYNDIILSYSQVLDYEEYFKEHSVESTKKRNKKGKREPNRVALATRGRTGATRAKSNYDYFSNI